MVPYAPSWYSRQNYFWLRNVLQSRWIAAIGLSCWNSMVLPLFLPSWSSWIGRRVEWPFVIFLFLFLILFFCFIILYWFCHTSTCICHGCTCVPHPEPLSHLPPQTNPLGHPSAPAPSFLYPVLNLDWWFVPYMILRMFQCHSPKSSHPLPLPQSP